MEKETEIVHTTSTRQTFTSAGVGLVALEATFATMYGNDILKLHNSTYSQCMADSILPPADCAHWHHGTAAQTVGFGIELGVSVIAGFFASRVAANLMGDRVTVIRERPVQKQVEAAPSITANLAPKF